MSNPPHLKYSKEHEWVSLGDGDTVTVGITKHAADALGDVVHVELPSVGDTVSAGETCGELESTKSVSDLYSPVSGEVVEVNAEVQENPGLVNEGPFTEGWLFRVRVSDDAGTAELLSAEEYTAFAEG
ncbi:glycine cleavage system protein GcvH [Allostreptomyces psammosilenae]|uniref:Glycine cleavage system H protein n=1 Tax=Allostreptomyces psammosilenae TaxID=1892865 RepID=A0A853A788_9ACTN|nr:glycine cleavage system protein GcvH [Allostreptomyces psammosilenae]NYI06531.1 glycine cleavage system H protein [Allostreptomyces psammosilenae]